MHSLRMVVSVLFLGAVMAYAIPSAKADSADWDTFLTFSAPVEIPGMVLAPGEYEFKLADSGMPAGIVEILNSKGHVMEFVAVAPDYRVTTRDKTDVTLERRAPGLPEAIETWFYPGADWGVQFVYPKLPATQAANTK